MEQNRLHP